MSVDCGADILIHVPMKEVFPEELAKAIAEKGIVAKTFGINELGMIAEGKKAVLLLIEGRPDKNITDTKKIKQIWIDEQPIL